MKTFLTLVVALLLVGCAKSNIKSQPTSSTDADGWSQPVDGIQARFRFAEGNAQRGTRMIRVFLELRNVSDMNNPRCIFYDPYSIKAQLFDSGGKEVPERHFNGFNNTDLSPICLPDDNSTVKVEATFNGWYTPNGEKAIIGIMSSGQWEIKKGDSSEYFLGGNFTVQAPPFIFVNEKPFQHAKVWFGTIQIPKAKVNVLNHE